MRRRRSIIGAAAGGGVIAAGLDYPVVALAGAVVPALGPAAVLLGVRRRVAMDRQGLCPG